MSDGNGQNGNNELSQEVTRRADWDVNHALIMDAYISVFGEKKRPPTQTEIAERCGLVRETVSRHFKDIKLDDEIPSVRVRTGLVLAGLANRAQKGFAAEVSLYMQLVHNWIPKSKMTHEIIDLSSVDVSKLPLPAMERINRGEPLETVLAGIKN